MIRLATQKDIEQVNIIRKQVNDLHVKEENKIFKGGWSKELEDFVNGFINSDIKKLVVLETDCKVCAYAMLEFVLKPETPYRHQLNYLHIIEFGTLINCQNKGYGTAILNTIKEIAKTNGIDRIELDAWSFNQKALSFYKKHGFNTYREYLKMEL